MQNTNIIFFKAQNQAQQNYFSISRWSNVHRCANELQTNFGLQDSKLTRDNGWLKFKMRNNKRIVFWKSSYVNWIPMCWIVTSINWNAWTSWAHFCAMSCGKYDSFMNELQFEQVLKTLLWFWHNDQSIIKLCVFDLFCSLINFYIT